MPRQRPRLMQRSQAKRGTPSLGRATVEDARKMLTLAQKVIKPLYVPIERMSWPVVTE